MMIVLSNAGATIWLDEGSNITSTLINVNTTEVLNETITTSPNSIILVQPVWVMVHYLFAIMLILYFIWNMLQLFTKRE